MVLSRAFVFTLLLSFAVTLAGCSKTKLAVSSNRPSVSEKKRTVDAEYPNLVHPVLGVATCEPLSRKKFDKVDYNKLCHMDTGSVMPYFWEKTFDQAEVDAAWLLAEKFNGYPKTAILEMLGTPDISGKIPPAVKDTGTALEQLTYFVGGEKECVMFLFSDPNRAQSRFLGWDESFAISNWITNKVAKNAVGKTYEQIVKENGIAGYVPGRAFEVPPESKNSTFTTSFIFGDTSAVDLEFSHGVCTKASMGAIFH